MQKENSEITDALTHSKKFDGKGFSEYDKKIIDGQYLTDEYSKYKYLGGVNRRRKIPEHIIHKMTEDVMLGMTYVDAAKKYLPPGKNLDRDVRGKIKKAIEKYSIISADEIKQVATETIDNLNIRLKKLDKDTSQETIYALNVIAGKLKDYLELLLRAQGKIKNDGNNNITVNIQNIDNPYKTDTNGNENHKEIPVDITEIIGDEK